MLDVFLALDRGADVCMTFDIDQASKDVAFGETFNHTRAVFGNAAGEIAGDTDVEPCRCDGSS